MSNTYETKKIFNSVSKEEFLDAKIVGGDPNGIMNFNRCPHKFAYPLYKKMIARTWFPDDVNISKDKVNYSTLTGDEKRMYDLVLAQLIANDSIQANQLADKINGYITSPIVNACLIRQAWEESNHCFAEGTEILTSTGFKDFRELNYKDKVANYMLDGSIFFKEPIEIISSSYNGPMVNFEMKNLNMLVTPNHRVVKSVPAYDTIRNYSKPPQTIVIEEAASASLRNYDIPVAGYNLGGTLVFTPLEALAVAYQADGTKVNNKDDPTINGYSYRFTLKRQDKINRIQTLINVIGCKYTKTYTSDGYTHFYVWVPMKFDKNFDWVTLEDKSVWWLLNFIEELKYWDGSIRNNEFNKTQLGYGSILYTNTNKKAIDKVIAIAALTGSQTGVYEIDISKENCNNKVPAWQIHIVIGKDRKSGRSINKSLVNYIGNIYCVTVDTGMIICRYKNTVFVSGNSQSYAIMAEEICQDTDRIYDMHNHDEELMIKNQAVEHMYMHLYNGDDPTIEDLLMAMVANQILETLVFPGGFVAMFSLENKLPGSSEMVSEISVTYFPGTWYMLRISGFKAA